MTKNCKVTVAVGSDSITIKSDISDVGFVIQMVSNQTSVCAVISETGSDDLFRAVSAGIFIQERQLVVEAIKSQKRFWEYLQSYEGEGNLFPDSLGNTKLKSTLLTKELLAAFGVDEEGQL